MNHDAFTRTILLSFCLLVFSFNNILAQSPAFVIVIKAGESGQPLNGATVSSLNSKFRTISDSSGIVVIPEAVLQKGERIEVSMIGFKNVIFNTRDIIRRQAIEMEKDLMVLEQVIVSENTVLSKVKDIQMGTVTITAVEARKLPSILGEVDIIKLLQLKPGVKTAGEGLAGSQFNKP